MKRQDTWKLKTEKVYDAIFEPKHLKFSQGLFIGRFLLTQNLVEFG